MKSDFDIGAEEDSFFDSDPIYDFPNLKERLTDMGIQIGEAGTWRSVGTIDVAFILSGKGMYTNQNFMFANVPQLRISGAKLIVLPMQSL